MGTFLPFHVWCITVLILMGAGLAGPVSAVTISESPSNVMPGEPITIDIDGLSSGSEFSLLIEATLQVTPGQDFLFETTNFVMPIALKDGQISATTTGTQRATYSAAKGTTEVSVTRTADANGVFSFSQAQSIPAGTFDFIRLEGTPQPDKNTIVSSIQLLGKKTGPDSSVISFEVNGIDNGRIQLVIFVDGTQVLYKTVTIGNGISPVQTTSSSSSPSDNSPAEGIRITGTLVQPGTNSSKTFFSADRTVSLTLERVDFAALIAVKATGVYGNWTLFGDAVTIAPGSLTFSPNATLSFLLPGQPDPGVNYTYFIGDYRNSRWVALPSTVNAKNVTAPVGHAGTYALMAFRNETVPPAVIPDSIVVQESPTTIEPVVQETSPAQTATKAPPGILPVFGALAIGAGIALGKRR